MKERLWRFFSTVGTSGGNTGISNGREAFWSDTVLKTTRFDAGEHLDTPQARAEYLTAALETGDADFVRDAFGVIARAEGMTKVARRAGRSRESLYRSLSKSGNPELKTVVRLLPALGLKLMAVPERPRRPAGAARGLRKIAPKRKRSPAA